MLRVAEPVPAHRREAKARQTAAPARPDGGRNRGGRPGRAVRAPGELPAPEVRIAEPVVEHRARARARLTTGRELQRLQRPRPDAHPRLDLGPPVLAPL